MEKNPQESTQVGPIGRNILTLDRDGCILSSGVENFIVGNTLWDYVPERYHAQILDMIEALPWMDCQPVSIDFEVLFRGRYYPRQARVYYTFEHYLVDVDDMPVTTNVIDYASLSTKSENFFTVDQNGLVLGCRYPEKTINGNPVGLNIFDVLLPQYVESVRATMRQVLCKRIELPVEYEFEINGEGRYKTGTIQPHGDNVVFRVKRIAPPRQEITAYGLSSEICLLNYREID